MKLRIFFALIIAIHTTVVSAMSVCGHQKKHIGLLFDVMNTTPSNILSNAENFAAYAPYLDGVSICLNNVLVNDDRGNVVTSAHFKIMSSTDRWTRDAVRKYIPTLREISKKPHLTESFLLFWMTPHDSAGRLNWADDKAWANYAENMATVAWLAKEGWMKGLMLDPEEYSRASQYSHTRKDPPYDECARLARKRGREVFSRVFMEYPDAVLFTLWYFSGLRGYADGLNLTNPTASIEDRGGLAHHFYNGILDVLPPQARIVDGCEHYSLSATKFQYFLNANSILTSVLPFVLPENITKYRSQVLAGNTMFLDMYTQTANPKSRWYHGPVDGSRLEHLRRNFVQSLSTATEYVWIYAEKSGKLFNWSNGHYSKVKTWEENIPGMTETFMLAKDPARWAAIRREKLAAEGKLVNLMADATPLKIVNPPVTKEYDYRHRKMPIVKNVRPGDRYILWVSARASVGISAKPSAGRRESVCPRVIWLKGNKQVGEISYLDVPAAVTNAMTRIEGIVTAPDGADSFIFDLACRLKADENVEYRYPSVCNALDPVKIEYPLTPIELAVGSPELLERPKPPSEEDFSMLDGGGLELDDTKVKKTKNEKPASFLKWKLDLGRNRLFNGHWMLRAWERKGKLYVSGFGSETTGGGVLDLRNVKKDIGRDIDEIDGFRDYQGITALVSPGVKRLGIRSFMGCTNLRACVVGDILMSTKPMSPISRRIALLNYISQYKGLIDTDIRFNQRHNIISGHTVVPKNTVKNVKPGELYNFMASMRRYGPGSVNILCRFRDANGRFTGASRSLSLKQPRVDGLWRDGEAVLRAPKDAAEACFEIRTELYEGNDVIEVDKFKIYKIGDPIPPWPEQFELEKGSDRK